LTIIIIAHRLTSIKSASNLLFIEGRNKIKLFQAGTDAYNKAINRLKNFTYAFGEGENEEVEQKKITKIRQSSVND
jgi:ABC-type bacteriocin/lantibiotic exporter with double-glycine peptidase domain